MNRPPLEMADIVRFAGQPFLERSQRWISWLYQKVLLAITRCRTAEQAAKVRGSASGVRVPSIDAKDLLNILNRISCVSSLYL
jgi:hypothetical protein